jgi:hypothetical protein
MNGWNWFTSFVALWFVTGRLYAGIWNLLKAGITWRQLIFDKMFHIMYNDAGLFGIFTPYTNYRLKKKKNGNRN